MICAAATAAVLLSLYPPAVVLGQTDAPAKKPRDVVVPPTQTKKPATGKSATTPVRTWDSAFAALGTSGDIEGGPSEHLWVIQKFSDGQFAVLHRLLDDKADEIYRVLSASGKISHIAAYAGRLYIVYEDRSVQMVSHRVTRDPQVNPYPITQLAPLPPKAKVLDLGATRAGPVALVEMPPEAEAPAEASSAAKSAKQNDEDSAESAPPPIRAGIRLLRQSGGAWAEMTPHPDLPPSGVRELVVTDGSADRLAVISAPPNGAANGGLRIDDFNSREWATWHYDLKPQPQWQFAGLQDIYLVQPQTLDPLRLEVIWLRRGTARKLGEFPSLGNAQQWWALPGDDRVIVLTRQDNQLSWTWRSVTADAAAPPPPQALRIADPPPLMSDPMLLIVIALVVGILLLFATARRDPQANVPKLPPGIRTATINRIIAAAIDFAPALVLAMYLFELRQPGELFRNWPTVSPNTDDWAPALATIGLYVGHTLLTELFTGATLGKLILGCRVTNMSGERAQAWLILTRNLFKAVELSAPILLVMPLLSPDHQRLGDLIARTLVISKRPGPPPAE